MLRVSETVRIRLQKIRWIVSGSSSFCPPLLYDWLSIREISVRGLYKEKQQYGEQKKTTRKNNFNIVNTDLSFWDLCLHSNIVFAYTYCLIGVLLTLKIYVFAEYVYSKRLKVISVLGFSSDSKSAVPDSCFWAGTPTFQENLTKLHSGTPAFLKKCQ